MKTWHFHLELSEQSPLAEGFFSASLVLGGEWTLYEFAEFIIKTVGFDFDHAFEFHDDPDNPYASEERFSLFADIGESDSPDDPGVRETRVSAVFRAGREMGFLFDYGDDWGFRVGCTAVEEAPQAKRRFRKVLAVSGVAPVQYEDPEGEDGEDPVEED